MRSSPMACRTKSCTTLAKVADLRVISRTSVAPCKDPEKRNLKDISQALHAPTGDELQACISAMRLASICGQVGETERALGLLEQTARLPGGPSFGELKLREEWDPLRSQPRFTKILQMLAPKGP